MDRVSFLCEKAENFRVYLLGQNPDSELSAQLEGFKKSSVLPTLIGVFLPSLRARGSEALVAEMLSHLKPDDPLAVKAKLERYVLCFEELSLNAS